MSRAWLQAAAQVEDLEVVGLVDLHETAALTRKAEFKLEKAKVGTDLETVLSQTQPDVLFDCTVPEAHHKNALLAFRHGIHVLGEKPLADSLLHAKEMVEAARRAGCIHAVIQNRRYDPNIRRVRRFLVSETIGPLTTLNVDFYIGAHFGGFRDTMDHVLLLDMAIHTFDAARLITGQDPLSVYCLEWNPQGSWYRHGASAMAIFEMTGGVVFNYRGSWCAEGFHTTWESDWRAIGTQGTLLWDGGEQLKASIVEHPALGLDKTSDGLFSDHREMSLPSLEPQDRIGGHSGLIHEMVECIRFGGEPETTSSDNIKSLAMVFAAIESASSGCKVQVNWN